MHEIWSHVSKPNIVIKLQFLLGGGIGISYLEEELEEEDLEEEDLKERN